ncbi:sugar ABC transporter substrate-binding protein [Brachybacterium sp. FME24]|uniref:ABC transporter substrate-binding protein n=1 Tax=Brachybacterium sp. FME24 TaxID=2742605 RepID=UPI0018691030|nr:sugar ABC transporter substrate-binding protein [Brachybacterium sp. FME24]
MSNGALGRRTVLAGMGAASAAGALAACGSSGGSGGDGKLEFQQWWEPELPEGFLRELMDEFEEANDGITVELLSGPYAATKEQLIAGAASRTMPDVLGLDGAWVNDLASQNALGDLDQLMSDASYDDADLAAKVEVDGATRMIPVVNFAYMLFANRTALGKAGIDALPTTREEFTAAAKAVVDSDPDVAGWVLPLSLEAPNGVQNDVMSWLWADGQSMLAEGKPALESDAVQGVLDYIVELDEQGLIAPGSATLKEQDKVEEFSSGRAAMIVDTVAHVNMFRTNSPDLDFQVAAMPTGADAAGTPGVTYGSWGIGVAEASENKEAAWKLVEFLMGEDVNARMATAANAFPGNSTAVPEAVKEDDVMKTAFDVWQSGTPVNEFVGLPVAEQLMREFAEQLQKTLEGSQSVDEALAAAQEAWTAEL